jgi:hypothetical protein
MPAQKMETIMPASDINTIEELHEYLYVALQLEHATLPVYLTALYSINFGTNPDATQILRVVAVEEMLHLTIAANIMNAVGGKVDLTVPGFVPSYPTYLPSGEEDFEVGLLPFTPTALNTFLNIERPSLAPSPGKRLRKITRKVRGGLSFAAGKNTEMQYYSIGDFYAALEDGMIALENAAQREGRSIFISDTTKQITPEYYYSGGGKLHAVTDLESARAGIRLIIEQGEGETLAPYAGMGELAHYYRFQQMGLQRYYLPGDEVDRPTGPAFTVDWDQVQPITPNLKVAMLPANSALRKRVEEFNEIYSGFLALLTRAYNGNPELLVQVVQAMFELRNRISELARNPIPGRRTNAGPTFEIS